MILPAGGLKSIALEIAEGKWASIRDALTRVA
jgi:hypothetical protein